MDLHNKGIKAVNRASAEYIKRSKAFRITKLKRAMPMTRAFMIRKLQQTASTTPASDSLLSLYAVRLYLQVSGASPLWPYRQTLPFA